MTAHTYTITLKDDERQELDNLLATPGINPSLHARASVLKLLDEGLSASEIVQRTSVARTTVYAISHRYRDTDLKTALYDGRKSGTPRRIPLEAFAWIEEIAGKSPRLVGVDTDRWTISGLQAYVRREGPEHGFPSLATMSRSYLWRIINGRPMHTSEEQSVRKLRMRKPGEAHMILKAALTMTVANIDGMWQFAPSVNPSAINLTREELLASQTANPRSNVEYDTMQFLFGFDSGSNALHVIQGTGHGDEDLITLIDEIDRSTTPGVMIELLESTVSPMLTPAVCSHLFAKAGRIALVRNRRLEKLVRMKLISKALLEKSRAYHELRAPTRRELANKFLKLCRNYRVPD